MGIDWPLHRDRAKPRESALAGEATAVTLADEDASTTQVTERPTTPLELFVDLAFAAAVGALGSRLRAAPTLAHVGVYAALFVPVWWLWVVQTFAADRVDDGSTTHRLIVLIEVAAVGGVAAGAADTPGGGDSLFALAYLGGRAVPALLYIRAARRGQSVRQIAWSYSIGTVCAGLLWVTGLLIGGAGRYVSWTGAVLVELGLPFLQARAVVAAPRSAAHLSDRYGLFTLVVLGEGLLGPISALERSPRGPALVAAALALSVAACLWWAYYSSSEPHPAFAGGFAQLQTFSLGHLPLTLGVAATGTGGALLVEQAAGKPGAALAAPGLICLYGGTALFLLAAAGIRAAFTGRDPAVRARTATGACTLVLGALATWLPALAGAAALLTALIALLIFEGPRAVGDRMEVKPNHADVA